MGTEPAPPTLEVTPADVAAWLRARTQDDEGREQGLFTEATRPTAMQVETAITMAHSMVAMRVGWETPVPCLEAYKYTVALAAACIVEKSYFPEQIGDNRSAYVQLNDELTQALENLYRCISDGGLGPSEGGAGGGASAYSICTPIEHCGGSWPFVPANWNNPYASDVDSLEEQSAALSWLMAQQPGWAGEVDQYGRPIAHAPASVDTRPPA